MRCQFEDAAHEADFLEASEKSLRDDLGVHVLLHCSQVLCQYYGVVCAATTDATAAKEPLQVSLEQSTSAVGLSVLGWHLSMTLAVSLVLAVANATDRIPLRRLGRVVLWQRLCWVMGSAVVSACHLSHLDGWLVAFSAISTSLCAASLYPWLHHYLVVAFVGLATMAQVYLNKPQYAPDGVAKLLAAALTAAVLGYKAARLRCLQARRNWRLWARRRV